MKTKIFVAALTFLFIFNSSAQTDSSYKKYRHELGADISGLLRQFFNLNQNNNYYPIYSPTYYFSYRYHLKKSSIRFGCGANYSKRAVYTYTVNGSERTAMSTISNFNFRIGYEKVAELSNKWQAFYGLDFRPAFINTNNEADNWTTGYINGTVLATQVYGFAPLLGFRFRIAKRVSILTETSFSFNIEKNSTQKTNVSLDKNLYPPLPFSKKITTTNLTSGFSAPLFLILTVDL